MAAMKTKNAFVLAACGLLQAWCAYGAESVNLPGRGTVSLSAAPSAGWTFSLSRRDDGKTPDVFEVEFSAVGAKESVPPEVCVAHAMPQGDIRFRLTPIGTMVPPIPWQRGAGEFLTYANGVQPLQAWIGLDDRNHLTHACSDQTASLKVYGYERDREGSSIHSEVTFFSGVKRPIRDYRAVLRFDFRKIPYWRAVTEAGDWMATFPGQNSPPVPEAAYDPLWDTWYAYHCAYDAAIMEREGDVAAELGLKTVVYDMGWDSHGNTNASFACCGDWIPDPTDFPDMKGHLARMHAKGLRCLLWHGTPLLGREAKNLERFKPYILPEATRSSAQMHVLDPRFPEVRRYAIDSVCSGVFDWGADGWKIDFLQRMTDGDDDPVAKEGLNGRDYRWVCDAAKDLQEAMSAEIRKRKPDALFEYMLGYCGVLGQRDSTHMRASDCPGDSVWNRNQSARLRLLCGRRSVVHSDPLLWNVADTPEACGLQFISVLHAVLQLSMRLTTLTPEQRRVVRHWIGFQLAHRETLLKGAFRPHAPFHSYPLIEMESAAERIVTVHQAGQSAVLAAGKPTYAMNGTDVEGLVVEAPADGVAEIFDTYGVSRGTRKIAADVVRLDVPRAGYVHFRQQVK